MQEKEDNGFTVLENKNIGRNLSTFRKLRDRKAMEVAEHLGIKEATYTKYERGESKITIDLIQKVSEFLNVDPLQIVTANPGYVIENLTNSPFSINSSNNTNNINDKQTEVMMKMMETMMDMNQAVKKLLEDRK